MIQIFSQSQRRAELRSVNGFSLNETVAEICFTSCLNLPYKLYKSVKRFLRNPTDVEMAYWLTKYTNKGHNT